MSRPEPVIARGKQKRGTRVKRQPPEAATRSRVRGFSIKREREAWKREARANNVVLRCAGCGIAVDDAISWGLAREYSPAGVLTPHCGRCGG